MEKNSDWPAFPFVSTEWSQGASGLTKRELIAAMTMQGILANPELKYSDFGTNTWTSKSGMVIELTLKLTDELLKTLES